MANILRNLLSPSSKNEVKSSRRKSEVVQIRTKNGPFAIQIDDYSTPSEEEYTSKNRRFSVPESVLRSTGISALAPIHEV